MMLLSSSHVCVLFVPGCVMIDMLLRVCLPLLSGIWVGIPRSHHTSVLSKVATVSLEVLLQLHFCVLQSTVCDQLLLRNYDCRESNEILYIHMPDLASLFQFVHTSSLHLSES